MVFTVSVKYEHTNWYKIFEDLWQRKSFQDKGKVLKKQTEDKKSRKKRTKEKREAK